jgi:hypothetical protein
MITRRFFFSSKSGLEPIQRCEHEPRKVKYARCKHLIVEGFGDLASEDMQVGELVIIVKVFGLPFSDDIYDDQQASGVERENISSYHAIVLQVPSH